jgi:hypothetical protein
MKPAVRVIHWIPRILCILAILFISFFALDAFSPGFTIWQQLGAFAVHLIPSYILIALLVIAWKREFTGGIIFAAIGIVFSPLIFMINHGRNHISTGMSLVLVLMINLPFVVVGVLFIISHFMKKRSIQAG